MPVHGNTDVGILRAVVRKHGLSDEEFAKGLPRALEVMRAEVERNAAGMQPAPCPSIADLLAQLTRAGKLLGVVSGNLEAIGWTKLRAAGLRDYFAFGSFSDRAELRRDIFRNGVAEARRRTRDGARVCMFGDTPNDVAAAREIGVPVVAIATGIYSPESLAACGPDLCVTCCTELLPEIAQ